MRLTDGRTDGRLTDDQHETIIPRHYCVVGYKKIIKMAAIIDIMATILAIFDLQVTSILDTKFQVNWPFGSGEEFIK